MELKEKKALVNEMIEALERRGEPLDRAFVRMMRGVDLVGEKLRESTGLATLSMNENAFGLVADAMDDFMMMLANINDCLRRDIYEARKNGN